MEDNPILPCDFLQDSELSKDGVSFAVYTNTGVEESNVALIALKNIFSRQLPKMPKDYIVRLVFDQRHLTLAIKVNSVIIGGICYRPYHFLRFGEIAFCAINGSDQVRGYGTKLMNALKAYVQKYKLEYFLTYADNYAIGYFQRQGFSKQVSMPKDRWTGFIKDYDGGTLMECYVHPNVNYLATPQLVENQKSFVIDMIRKRSRMDTIYQGISELKEGKRLCSIMDAPGVQEAGWTMSCFLKGSTERDHTVAIIKLQGQLKQCMEKIKSSPHFYYFMEPVDTTEVPDYLDIIKDPIDLSVIQNRLKMGDYYRSPEMILGDLFLMTKNCKTFNSQETIFHNSAVMAEKVIRDVFKEVLGSLPSAYEEKSNENS